MTNEMIFAAVPTNFPNAGCTIVCDGGLTGSPGIFLLWMFLLVVLPMLSIVLCVRAWSRKRRNKGARWTPRIIFGAAFLMLASTVLEALSGLTRFYFNAEPTVHNGALCPTSNLAMSAFCSTLAFGVVASSVCVIAALCLPLADPNRAVDSLGSTPR